LIVIELILPSDLSQSDHDRLLKTADLENFVVEFMNRCFTLIENTRCLVIDGVANLSL
jgi:hypothetical protein